MSNGAGGNPGRDSKVARIIEKYDMDGAGDDLERKWTAEGNERCSLRTLADEFNRRILRRTLEEAGVQVVDGELENTYRLLTGDGVSDADRTRVSRRLERDGVDVEQLTSDFVSYQAVRTYLQNYRDASYEPASADRVERAADTIQRLRSRTTAVTETKLAQLDEADSISLGEFQVINDLRVICEDCNGRYEVGELLAGQGCDCT